MIVADRKPWESLARMLEHGRILLVGCGDCVTVCMAGGEKEVGVLAAQLRLAAREQGLTVEVRERTVTRACERECGEQLAADLEWAEGILCLACGAGVQKLAELYPDRVIRPGVDTRFVGAPTREGEWTENCALCGDCVLGETGGICPVARCSKGIFNGPCGGSVSGKCEVNKETECAWQLIVDRLERQGRTEFLEAVQPPRNWALSRDGGPRRRVREDMLEEKDDE